MNKIYSNDWFREKRVEPIKRKHGSLRPEWQSHRFPIKDGISWHDAMMLDMTAPSNMFVKEFAKGDYRIGETLKIRLPSDHA